MEPVISSIPDGSETLLRSQPGQASPWWPFCFICHHHPRRNGRVGSRPEPGGSLRWQSCSPACQGLTGTVRTWVSSEEEAGGPGASCPYHFLSSLVCWVAHLRSRPHCSGLAGRNQQDRKKQLCWPGRAGNQTALGLPATPPLPPQEGSSTSCRVRGVGLEAGRSP